LSVKSTNDTERKRARSAFQLAAAQVVMNQPTCKLAQARAATLVSLFPDQLGQTLDPLTKPTLSIALCKQLDTSGGSATVFEQLLNKALGRTEAPSIPRRGEGDEPSAVP
jgi:hypothetical protein